MPENPIVIDPPNFDEQATWDYYKPYMDRVVDDHGNLNMGAAMFADPGVCACPNCDTYYWCLGKWQRCRHCDMEFPTDAWPAYSYGVQHARRHKVPDIKYAHHPYYLHGISHPHDGDAWEEYHQINWLQIMGKKKFTQPGYSAGHGGV